MKNPKVLVACEESQQVTKRLRNMGIEAYSADIMPTSGNHPEWHIQDDVRNHTSKPWDMIIAFPPCTHLASSGARHFDKKRQDGRQQEGIDFFNHFTQLDCPRIAIENPVGIMSTIYRKPDQIIQPYYFGESFSKKTCLWLKGLPKLHSTNIVDPGEFITFPSGKRMSKFYYDAKLTKNTSKIRSKTFDGIADAMASQWGTHILQI